ncbi:43933_t:CDS:10 [Gigaspora margarita]|uniref:43933_t:CDS:1 n=1 Tax=Gigaspora margarita TaxID=4874 RepID=A0ABN7UWB3_GIGMA|nr:43933_t:CDS:10 [Gigaspora margarita]
MDMDSDTATMRGSDDDCQESDKISYEQASSSSMLKNNNLQSIESEDDVEFEPELDKTKSDKKRLGAYRITKNLYVDEICYSILPMEYPITSEKGVAIIFNVEYVEAHTKSQEYADKYIDVIQYDLIKRSNREEVNCYFINTKVKNTCWHCQGIKVCEFFQDINKGHCNVDIATDFINVDKSHMRYKDRLEKSCDGIFAYNSKRITCGFLHYINGTLKEGILKKLDCNVKFFRIVPIERKVPYVILVCKGKHSHPPPPPNSINPHMINMAHDLTSTILPSDAYINLNSDKLLSNNFISAVIGDEVFQEIQNSLSDGNKLRKLIAKVQKSSFGQDMIGLLFNIWSKNLSDYIRQFAIFKNSHIIIICMSEDQVKAWLKLEYFEIVSFSNQFYGNITELTINGYDDNREFNAKSYKQMFLDLFKLTNVTPKFYYLHKEGWKCIRGNLNKVQLEGLGEALRQLNHGSYWDNELQKIYKFCRLDFLKEIKNSNYSEDNQNLMKELLDALPERIREIFKLLRYSNEGNIDDWVEYYASHWVLGLLNPNKSQINNEIWNLSPDFMVESCDKNAYHDGNVTLLNAILKAKNFDKQQYSDMKSKKSVSKKHLNSKGKSKQTIIENSEFILQETQEEDTQTQVKGKSKQVSHEKLFPPQESSIQIQEENIHIQEKSYFKKRKTKKLFPPQESSIRIQEEKNQIQEKNYFKKRKTEKQYLK